MLDLFLHYLSFSLMVIIICMACVLMVLTKDTQNLSALATLKENVLIYIFSLGAMLQAMNIIPIYYARYPFWRDFKYHKLSPLASGLVCSFQLWLFHSGFILFHTALFLGIYRMSMRISRNTFASKIKKQVLLVICLPILALIGYFIVWLVFYQHPPETCLTSRHHDYLFIVENAILLLNLFVILPIHQIYPRRDSKIVCLALVVSLVVGILLYFLRLYTENVWSSGLAALLAELHAWTYVLILLVANIKWKIQMGQADTRESVAISRRESARKESVLKRESFAKRESFSKRELAMRKSQVGRESQDVAGKRMSFSLIRRLSRRVSPPTKDLEKGKLQDDQDQEESEKDAVYELSLDGPDEETYSPNGTLMGRKRGDVEWYKIPPHEHDRWY